MLFCSFVLMLRVCVFLLVFVLAVCMDCDGNLRCIASIFVDGVVGLVMPCHGIKFQLLLNENVTDIVCVF